MFLNTEQSYFIKAVHDAKISELIDKYQSKGYAYAQDEQHDGCEFDVVFRHPENNHAIAFEVKVRSGDGNPYQNQRISKFRRAATRNGMDFRLATVVMPGRRDIQIAWFHQALQDYIASHQLHLENPNIPENAKDLLQAADQGQQRVKNVNIESIRLLDGEIAELDGQGLYVIEDEDRYEIELPFDGKFKLDLHNQIVRTAKIYFDYSFV